MKKILFILSLICSFISVYSQDAIGKTLHGMNDVAKIKNKLYGMHVRLDSGHLKDTWTIIDTTGFKPDGGIIMRIPGDASKYLLRNVDNSTYIKPEWFGGKKASSINKATLYLLGKMKVFGIGQNRFLGNSQTIEVSAGEDWVMDTTVVTIGGISYDFKMCTFTPTVMLDWGTRTPPSANSTIDLPSDNPFYNYSKNTLYPQIVNLKNLIINDSAHLLKNGVLIETASKGSVENVIVQGVTRSAWDSSTVTVTQNTIVSPADTAYYDSSIAYGVRYIIVDNPDSIYRNAGIAIWRPSENRYLMGSPYQVNNKNGDTIFLSSKVTESILTGDNVVSWGQGFVVNSNQITVSNINASQNDVGIVDGRNYKRLIFDDGRFYNCFTNDNLVGFVAQARQRDRIINCTFQHNYYWNMVWNETFSMHCEGLYPEVDDSYMVNTSNNGVYNYSSLLLVTDGSYIETLWPVHFDGSGGRFQPIVYDGRNTIFDYRTGFDNYSAYTAPNGDYSVIKVLNYSYDSLKTSLTLNLSGDFTHSQVQQMKYAVVDRNYQPYKNATINANEALNFNFRYASLKKDRTIYTPNSYLGFIGSKYIGNNSFPSLMIKGDSVLLGKGDNTYPTEGIMYDTTGFTKVINGLRVPKTLRTDDIVDFRGKFGTSGTTLISDTTADSSRLIWYPKNANLLAGFIKSYNTWRQDSLGIAAIGFGYEVKPYGFHSIAIGDSAQTSNATGGSSSQISIGKNTYSSGVSSIALGNRDTSTSTGSIAIGTRAIASGTGAVMLADYSATASIENSTNNLFKTQFSAGYDFGFVSRTSRQSLLINNTPGVWTIYPGQNNMDLGSPSQGFRDLNVYRNANISGKAKIVTTTLGSSTDSILVKGSDTTVKAIAPLPTIASGAFTSTFTNTTNISSSTLRSATYTRVGNVITCRITGLLTPSTISTATVLDFTLPVNPGGTTQLQVGTITFGYNDGSNVGYVSGQVDINSSSGTANFICGPTATSGNFTIIIQYIISVA